MKSGTIVFNFLCQNATERFTPEKWASILDIKILDADGWHKGEYEQPCDLTTFIQKAARSTIMPVR